jgi:asparagine synthase (glutamine-hydrolysing)
MCGIAGILSQNKSLVHPRSLKTMSDALAHRGQDGEGQWINPSNNVGLAHRRLAIIDLSTAAAQPMHYADRYSITYNGEIYNYKELKTDLQKVGYRFITESDTEVILAAYDFYEKDCVQYFDGMFAFAIWDEKMQELFCARDTFGEKPFYYFLDAEAFAFASEMKALWSVGVDKKPDAKMVLNFLGIGQVQNANNKVQTFFTNIQALPPAHRAVFSLQEMKFTITRFKDINRHTTIKITEDAAIEKLDYLLQTSISKRLRSDVPVGTSMSGGVDSSTIAYFANNQKAIHKFKTFSAVFPGFEKDETVFIKALVQQFNCENYTTTPTEHGLLDDFDKLCYQQEEPFTSSSIYAQYKVYELAKEHNIKVLLDGQGADEILGGYTKYIHWYLQELISHYKFGKVKKEQAAFFKNNIDVAFGLKNIFATYLPTHAAMALEKKAYNKIANNKNINEDYLQAIKGKEWQGIYKPTVTKLNDILYHNTMEHGLEELLRYADRNSMAHGVEVRLPFLNTELVQFIFSLPSSLKMSNGFTKNILRKTMQDKIPNNILWNPTKIGFEPPQKMWMENKEIQNRIHEAKQKLVNEKILKATVLKETIKASAAHEDANNDWRYLSLAAVL